ncbi:bacterial mobilization protein MobC [Prevotella disiens JCM 6334 = ATCC 29426]|uniref:Bacterial mobilisation protein (MobC) n=4 Tax=Prevotella disiens TaxID=28130 RepID=A0A379DW86_9BACT|nr:bacterial mobilization protein MobC [Prevotella disiens JCM 6334 = ATCC 29426]SUB84743.1 Bacterial mobilisation protein (MobC) [Prevotella disiens]
MIVEFALYNLFVGEQVYVLGIPKLLALPPNSRCRGLSRRSPSNQIKETSMIKTEYKKGGRPTKGVAEKKKYRITVKLNTQDYYTLKGKAKSAGVTMSEFVRKVLDKGNVIERLTVEQADFIRKLCGIANNLNQLAHRANADGFHAVAPFHKTIIGKIDEILTQV